MPKVVAYPLKITNTINKILKLLPSHLTLTLECHSGVNPAYRVVVRQRHAPGGFVRSFESVDELSFYLNELLDELEKRKQIR
jgi:hypothetical protein